MTKLNIGGGKGHPRLPGWTIVDLRDNADLVHDISKDPLPFADGSVDVIFTSHTLEHIMPQRLGFVLGEFRRVIKPAEDGGLVRILVPDIARAVRAYQARDEEFFKKSELTPFDRNAPLGGMLMSWFYSTSAVGHGHCHCFDEEYLAYWLKNHGFTRAERTAFGESSLPELRSDAFDRHPNDSLCMEAAWSRNG